MTTPAAAPPAGTVPPCPTCGRLPAPPLPTPLRPLTARELEVAQMVATGKTNAAIGRALGIAAPTVNAHLRHMLAATGLPDRAALVAYALRAGLIQ